ncbi:hypothetical protein RKE25_22290 (plasmid) [Dyella sp. BiH032]|uniref:hypothetical protein n=1 Tax=Dyella sp. BiH032 TaxID=3075430 RepID=UPI00289350D4|nr:hypothetical protein [Dyella sp. BiH032]WNL48462.1 hypothetical protein RKE25_22290 [Dyella sp. BiH032]
MDTFDRQVQAIDNPDQSVLPGFTVAEMREHMGPRAAVSLDDLGIQSLEALGDVLNQIRYLATTRSPQAFAQIEILAGAMCKTPRLLADGSPFGTAGTIELELAAGRRALAIGVGHAPPQFVRLHEALDRDAQVANSHI